MSWAIGTGFLVPRGRNDPWPGRGSSGQSCCAGPADGGHDGSASGRLHLHSRSRLSGALVRPVGQTSLYLGAASVPIDQLAGLLCIHQLAAGRLPAALRREQAIFNLGPGQSPEQFVGKH